MSADEFALVVPAGLVEAVATRVAELLGTPDAGEPDPYLSVEEAAAYLSCPPSRIYDLKASGRLAHYRDGRRLLFRREDLDSLLTRVAEAEALR